MDSVEYLVVGAGVSGLSFANWLRAELPGAECLILERDGEPGGYCKTVEQDGFVWDYSGHFFHFRHRDIEQWLRERMPGQEVRTVQKRTFIRFKGRDIDFPFQKNIHQLPRVDFIDCLVDLYFRDESESSSFKQMLYSRLGRSISDLFLVPYNEKLYACDLDRLDAEAMGRFFPHADIADIIGNMRSPDNASYNASFSYPRGGAIQYVNALMRDLPAGSISYQEPLISIDLEQRIAHTSSRSIRYQQLVSSAPLNRLADACGLQYERAAFGWNKVLVFNLGFDRKGRTEPHWMYFPDPAVRFYRVGWYDNIMGGDRMSLYVEIGADPAAELDVEVERARVLADLRAEQVITDQQLVSWHTVTMDPAYVHITQGALREQARLLPVLSAAGVHPVGRYGGWTYCSIEDNILETRALARELTGS